MSSTTHIASGPNPSFGSLSKYAPSLPPSHPSGALDFSKPTTSSAHWERTLWKKLEVGDIVLLRENDQVPADIVVLSTSDPDGLCYLETKNLDGETNLKPRRALKATWAIRGEEDVERCAFVLDSEPPHANLYLYHGVLRYRDASAGGEKKTAPVTINELLLRGCSLRNTQWVIGLVVFTGSDTKIMLNGGDTPSKRSKIEKETNFNVVVNFVVLTLMCVVAAIFYGLQDADFDTSYAFFEKGADPTRNVILNSLVTLISCVIAFQNIVPISLYISIEIVKTIQAYFISQDIDMYYEGFDTPCVPKTWNISDDLGQIEYIFSDKTGTLTQNVMEFQRCSIGGIAYGEGVTEAMKGAQIREASSSSAPNSPGPGAEGGDFPGKLASMKTQMIGIMERTFKNRYIQQDKLTLVSPKLAEDMAERGSKQKARIVAFFKALALCHSVLADRPGAGAGVDPKDPEGYKLEYKAESPDEAALVGAARDVGFPFLSKGKEFVEVEIMGQLEKYALLKTLEFNSTRKRMSTIYRCPDGKIVLYTKGADSVIYARLSPDQDPYLKEKTAKDMEAFANGGLRTLCVAHRYLSEEEYLSWERGYDRASAATEGRDEEIEKSCEEMERNLEILGATALEDKLQEGVPEAIEMLHRAGIKLWILTGDKLQTAIEIGYSCNLLKKDMDVMILSCDTPESTRSHIEAGLNKIASVLGPPNLDPKNRGFMPNAKASFAVVIDGDTLRFALGEQYGLKALFLNLATQCETVVCCRVSPAQKALTVKLVKEGRDAMTLSIGDGANDVAMIQEANIGCGLFGLEGSQAAMSADYAFGQFRFLTKLLLVHGRWSYQRVADMHANFFYKNVIWTFAPFWYLPFNNFNATYLYQYTFILLYNLAFTSLPVIILGAFDQDLNAKAALAFPQLYVRGIRGLEYTRAKFWLYMGDGLYQSAIVFFVPYMVYIFGLPASWTGRGVDSVSDFGTTVAVSAIFAANTYVGINTNYWTVITWIVVFGSTIVMMLWIVVYSFFFSADFIDEFMILFGTVQFWTTLFLTTALALGPHFILKFISAAYFPLDKDIVREAWVAGDLKDQLGIAHRYRRNRNGRREGSDYDAGTALESASMLQSMEMSKFRSMSEVGLHNPVNVHPHPHATVQGYEPAFTESPGMEGKPVRTTYLEESPPGSAWANDGQTQYARSQLHREIVPSPQAGNTPATARPLLNTAPQTLQSGQHMAAPQPSSPHGSYYSLSDLPVPSPPPSPVYKLPSGELTKTPPASRRGSVSSRMTRASIRQSISNEPIPTSSYPSPPLPTATSMVMGGMSSSTSTPTAAAAAGTRGRYDSNATYGSYDIGVAGPERRSIDSSSTMTTYAPPPGLGGSSAAAAVAAGYRQNQNQNLAAHGGYMERIPSAASHYSDMSTSESVYDVAPEHQGSLGQGRGQGHSQGRSETPSHFDYQGGHHMERTASEASYRTAYDTANEGSDDTHQGYGYAS